MFAIYVVSLNAEFNAEVVQKNVSKIVYKFCQIT